MWVMQSICIVGHMCPQKSWGLNGHERSLPFLLGACETSAAVRATGSGDWND